MFTVVDSVMLAEEIIANGESTLSLWRFCIVETSNRYESRLKHKSLLEATQIFVPYPGLTGDRGFDAALAALAQHFSVRDGWETPLWVFEPERETVAKPWVVPLLPSAIKEALEHSPQAFKDHGVFITRLALFSV